MKTYRRHEQIWYRGGVPAVVSTGPGGVEMIRVALPRGGQHALMAPVLIRAFVFPAATPALIAEISLSFIHGSVPRRAREVPVVQMRARDAIIRTL